MALGILGLFYIGILLSSIVVSILTLFSRSPKILKGAFIANIILTGIVISLTVTSLPTNYMIQKLIGLIPGIPCFAAILIYFKGSKKTARIVASIALGASILCLIFL